MPEQLYPKKRRQRDLSGRRWRVWYECHYDNGTVEWNGYYHFESLARIASWWNCHISSWGGTAVLIDQRDSDSNETTSSDL